MPRHAAWTLLRSGSPTPLRDVDHIARGRDLTPRDRALLRRLIGTEIRRRGTLRALVRHFAHKKPSPELNAHLHLGFVQAFFMDRIPDHALVSETLRAVHSTLGPSKVKFVNAMLRTAIRAREPGLSGDPRRDIVGRSVHLKEPVFHDPTEHPLLWAEDALSIPAQLYKRWAARLGDEVARGLALQALSEPPTSLRAIDPAQRDALAEELTAQGLTPRPGAHAALILVPPSETEMAVHSGAFVEGRLTVQGAAALAAAEALEAQPEERLLDLCAAPGGKTALLAGAGANVWACDSNAERLRRVGDTIARIGPPGRVHQVVSDGIEALEPDLFDGVMVDAPCTNTGVLAARPEARWRFSPAQKRELVALQARLLAEGATRVRSGGRLVWSTCSLDPDEGKRQVASFLADNAGWALELEHETLPDPETTADAGGGPTDGGYFGRVRRA